jgi:hypothetical protein
MKILKINKLFDSHVWGKVCSSIDFNVKYAIFIVAHMALILYFDISLAPSFQRLSSEQKF